MTVDPEPPQPQWLVQANLMNAVASLSSSAESSRGLAERINNSETVANLFQELVNNLDDVIPEVLFSYFYSAFHISRLIRDSFF